VLEKVLTTKECEILSANLSAKVNITVKLKISSSQVT